MTDDAKPIEFEFMTRRFRLLSVRCNDFGAQAGPLSDATPGDLTAAGYVPASALESANAKLQETEALRAAGSAEFCKQRDELTKLRAELEMVGQEHVRVMAERDEANARIAELEHDLLDIAESSRGDWTSRTEEGGKAMVRVSGYLDRISVDVFSEAVELLREFRDEDRWRWLRRQWLDRDQALRAKPSPTKDNDTETDPVNGQLVSARLTEPSPEEHAFPPVTNLPGGQGAVEALRADFCKALRVVSAGRPPLYAVTLEHVADELERAKPPDGDHRGECVDDPMERAVTFRELVAAVLATRDQHGGMVRGFGTVLAAELERLGRDG